MKAWTRYKQDETLYDGHRPIIRKHFQNDEGRTFDFETFEKVGSESVIILALDEDNQVIIAEQFRVGPEAVLQECPGGGVKKGQTPAEAAQLELLEETGYESDQWHFLGSAYEHPYDNRQRHYFLALNCHKVAEPSIDSLEDIEVKKISIEQLRENARTAQMTDALIVLYAAEVLKELNA